MKTRSTLLGLALIVSHLAAQPREIISVSAPSRDYHLFAGVELYMQQDGEMLPVRHLDGRYAILDDGEGNRTSIVNRSSYVQKRNAKVSNVSVEIENLKSRPVFSLANDPVRQSMLSQTAIADYLSSQVDRVEMAEREAADAARFSANAAIDTESGSGGGGQNPSSSGGAAPTGDPSMELTELGGDLGPDFYEDQIEKAEEEGNFDALLVSFVASSNTDLINAYVVVCAQIRVDGELMDLNFHERVGAVGPKPRKIEVERTNLPPGYEFVDARIHLFNNSEEVATSLSERRMDLTESEMREYVVLDHQSQHRGESRPAEPVWELAPPALATGRSAADFFFPVSVEVDATGTVTAIDAGSQILPEHIERLVRSMTFVPALQDGTPVPSLLAFNPADYFGQG